MANEKIKQNYKNIANAIRAKTGENGVMTAEEMPDKISAIETGITPTGTKSITANGDNIDVTNFAAVDVNVPGYPEPTGTYYINSNGEYNVKDYALANVSIASISCIGIENYYLVDVGGQGTDYVIYDQTGAQSGSLACYVSDGMAYINSADALTVFGVSTYSDVGTDWQYGNGISAEGGVLTIKLPCVFLVDDLENIDWSSLISGPIYIKLNNSTLPDDEAYDWFVDRFSHVKLQTLGFLNPNENFQRADDDYILIEASEFYDMVYISINSES